MTRTILHPKTRLQEILNERGIRGYRFAAAANIEPQKMYRYLKGADPISERHLYRICQVLRLQPEEIIAPLQNSDPKTSAP